MRKVGGVKICFLFFELLDLANGRIFSLSIFLQQTVRPILRLDTKGKHYNSQFLRGLYYAILVGSRVYLLDF